MLLIGVLDGILVLLLDLETSVVKHAVELTVKIDLVTLRLKLLVDAVEVLDLEHEVRHIVDWAL